MDDDFKKHIHEMTKDILHHKPDIPLEKSKDWSEVIKMIK